MANHAALLRAENAGLDVHRRGRRFIEFDLGNGRIRHVATIDPLHKRDLDVEIDATWYPDSGAWQWKIGENDWQAHARDVFNVGSLIEWRHSSGEWVIVDPQSINWINQDSSRQQIAIKQAVTGTANDATLTFTNAYGTGKHFEYIAHPRRLIKHFVIDNLSDLPAPEAWLTGTLWLEVEWTITNSAGVELYLDGVRWERKNKVKTQTSNRIEFRNVNTGEVLWYADAPHAADSGEGSIGAQYEVEATGGVYFIRVRVPREWLLSAAYPVKVDPTFTDGYGGDVTTSFDTYVQKNNANANKENETTFFPGSLSAADARNALIKFTLTSLDSATISSAVLSLFDIGTTSYASTYKVRRILAANAGWLESCTWNYADGSGNTDRWSGDSGNDGGNDGGCSVSGTDFSSTDMGSVALSGTNTLGTERTFTLDTTEFTTMVGANYGLAVHNTGTWERWAFCSSDYATTGYRPKLVVEYTTGVTESTQLQLTWVELQVPGSSVASATGTANITLDALALSASASASISGSAQNTLDALTLSASGTIGAVANANITLDALSVNGTGSVPSSGTANITLGALGLSASSTTTISGALSTTLGSIGLSASGALAVQGAANVTLGAVTLSGTGVIGNAPAEGVANITLGALTLSGSGDVIAQGAAVITLDALTVSASGSAAISGNANIALGSLTASASGNVAISGLASITLDAVTLAGTGVIGAVAAGTANITLGNATLSGAGTATIDGDANITLSGVTLSATGSAPIDGDANIALASVTLSGAGNVPVDADLSTTLEDLTLSGEGAITAPDAATGTLRVTLDAMTISASASVTISGVAAISLDDATVVAAGTSDITGEANISLGDLVTTTAATVSLTGALSVTLGNVTLTATAGLDIASIIDTVPLAGSVSTTVSLLGSVELSVSLLGSVSLTESLSGSV